MFDTTAGTDNKRPSRKNHGKNFGVPAFSFAGKRGNTVLSTKRKQVPIFRYSEHISQIPPIFVRCVRPPKEPSLFQDSDPAAVIATALKRTPGAGRERVVDPDNLTSPACAPEAYGGSAGGGEASSNPITGDQHSLSSTLAYQNGADISVQAKRTAVGSFSQAGG